MDHRGQLSPDLMIVESNILLNYVFMGFYNSITSCSKQLSALLRLQAQWCCCHSGQQHFGMCLSLCLHRNKAVDSSIHSMHECATENGQEGSNLYQQT